MLATWGRLVYRYRWAVLAASILSSIASLAVIRHGAHFDNRMVPADTESGRALDLLQAELPGRRPSFALVFGHPTLGVTDPRFRAEVERAVAPLRADPRVAAVRTAYDLAPPDPSRLGRDGRHTLVTVELQGHRRPRRVRAVHLGSGRGLSRSASRRALRSPHRAARRDDPAQPRVLRSRQAGRGGRRAGDPAHGARAAAARVRVGGGRRAPLRRRPPRRGGRGGRHVSPVPDDLGVHLRASTSSP